MKKKFYTKDLLKKHNIDVGVYTYGKPMVLDWGEGAKLKIGKFCSIADDVKIFLGGNHRADWVSTYPFSFLLDDWPEAAKVYGIPATKGDVIIGNDVWIGYGAIILSGLEIGDGAVIGAGAVVAKSVKPYAIVVGNPAREVKKRFDEKTIERLLTIKWWDWPIEKIRENAKTLCSDNVDGLIGNETKILRADI